MVQQQDPPPEEKNNAVKKSKQSAWLIHCDDPEKGTTEGQQQKKHFNIFISCQLIPPCI